MAEKIVIAQLDLDSSGLVKSAIETKRAIEDIKTEQKELTKSGETASEAYVRNEALLKTLTAEYRTQSGAISSLISGNGELLKTNEAITIALDKEINSIKDARTSNSELLKIRNELNLNTAEGVKAAEEINKKIDQNNEFIKENVSQLEKQKINVGNYTQSIKDAIGNTQVFGQSLTTLKTAFTPFAGIFSSLGKDAKEAITQIKGTQVATEGLTTAQKASAIATNAVSGALKLFRIALISTGIGAIVVVLGSLIAFLTTTQAGIDKVTAVTRPLQAIFQSLLGLLQNLGGALVETFTNPKKALSDLADFVKQNLINRFTAFGEILEGIINLDFKQLRNGIAQAATGIENLEDKIIDGAKATAKFLEDAAKRGAEIDRLTKEIEKSEINLNKQRAIAESRESELLLIARDTSRTAADREKAAREIIEIKKEEAKREAAILELRIERLIIEQSLNDTNRANNKELADLEAQLIKIKDTANRAELEQIRVISAARKEEQAAAREAQQRRIENNLKEAKAQIDLFEAQQGFRAKTLEEQFILEQTLTQKRIQLLEQEFQAGRKSKTEYEAERLNISNEFLQKQAELTVDFARRELEEFTKSNLSLIERNQFITEQLVIEENARLTQLAEVRREFERLQFEQGLINEQQYQDALLAIDAETQNKRDEVTALRNQQQAEADRIDLENRRLIEDLIFQDDLAIQQDRLEQKRLAEIEAAEKTGADVTKINQKFDALQVKLKRQAEIAKVQAIQDALRDVGALLNAFGVKNKNLTLAIATADTFLAAQKAYLSQMQLTPDSPARASVAAAKALAFGLANVARIAATDTKFEKGGIQMVGGKPHSQGGTKFVGSDGTRFEAERGELIGVLNKNASKAFMSFNDAFLPSGNRGVAGTQFAQNGGLIARNIDRGVSDLEQIAALTARAVANTPPPIVTVEDINNVAQRVNVIESGANF
jgi:hypothetical protein